MSFLRRDKNSVDEYSRARQEFTRMNSDFERYQPQSETATVADEYSEPNREDESMTPADEPVDPLEKYRKGATTVAEDTSFSGTLKSEGNLCIEGNFEGQLESSATIFIASTAKVQADLRATDVIVAGLLGGTVDASGRFHAMPTARVSGEINTAVLVVEEDSHVSCRFKMKRGEENNS